MTSTIFEPLQAAADRLVDEVEAGLLLGIKPHTLQVWRSNKRYDLPFTKIGRSVRYRLSDINAFIKARTVSSTGEADSL